MTRAEIIATARRVAARGGRKLTRRAFKTAGLTDSQIRRHFGSWSKLAEAAGLELDGKSWRHSNAQILDAMRKAFIAEGGVSTRIGLARHFRYSVGLLNRRFGGWGGALAAFRKWCQKTDPTFPYFEAVDKAVAQASSRGRRDATVREAKRQTLFGDFIHFEGFAHAPLNEQGVVLLFGMMARELGFVIERVQTAFPDCEAKRRTESGAWVRSRIEFEYQSRAFFRHRHDPRGCDLIVCWEHNWAECPLEVIELKSATRTMGDEKV